MSVVISEKTIRKIIQKKILKEGLFKDTRSYSGEGSTELFKCDLSNLKNTKAMRTLVKYILVKPKFTEVKDGKSTTFTRSMLFSMRDNPLTSEEEAKYDDLVDEWIQKAGSKTVEALIDSLEFLITHTFGYNAELFCKLVSEILLPGSYQENTTSTAVNQDENKEKIKKAFKHSGNNLVLSKDLSMLLTPDLKSYHMVMFPRTFITISENKDPVADFSLEYRRILQILEESNFTPERFIERLKRGVYLNIPGKSEIIQPFQDLLRKIENTESNGALIKLFIKESAEEGLVFLRNTHNLSY
jgi:hypothetical protein